MAAPTASALRQARQRLGVAPLRALFDLLRGPAATTATGAVSWRGLLVCAVDGTLMSVADSAANLTAVVKQRCNHGAGGYPTVRVLALVACGTRSVIDAVFGPASTGEPGYAARLAGSLRPGMLLLADRNFAAADLLTHLATTGADLLVRCKSGRRLPVRSRYPAGSYLSQLGSLAVRVIEAEISIVTSAGRRTGTLPSGHHPARPAPLPGRRADHPLPPALGDRDRLPGTEIHHPGRAGATRPHPGRDRPGDLRPAGHLPGAPHRDDATDTIPGLDPDRASFTIALHTARDQVIQAASVIADTVIDLVGAIGRRVLATLMPDRRVRTKPRIVKRAISKYNARGPDIDRTTYKATIEINIDTGP